MSGKAEGTRPERWWTTPNWLFAPLTAAMLALSSTQGWGVAVLILAMGCCISRRPIPFWLQRILAGLGCGCILILALAQARTAGPVAAATFLGPGAALLLTKRGCRNAEALGVAGIVLMALACAVESQSLGMTAWVCVVLGGLFAALALNRGGPHAVWMPFRIALAVTPVALLVFVLFPRMPAWSMPRPNDGKIASIGMSDTMTPGSIAELSASFEPAFTASLSEPVPASELYWRAAVLDRFDGRSWRGSAPTRAGEATAPRGAQTKYTLTFPAAADSRYFVVLDGAGQALVASFNEFSAVLPMDSQGLFRPGPSLVPPGTPVRVHGLSGVRWEERPLLSFSSGDVALPVEGNPRARQLAASLLRKHGSPRALAGAVLRMIHDDDFFYTLRPGRTTGDVVDSLLFDKKAGYCEHYAGAFAFVMRAAGVPARVVTGYAGGRVSPDGRTIEVLQRDAHAWVEVRFDDTGWERIDPTAHINPTRVDPDAAGFVAKFEPDSAWGRLRGSLSNLRRTAEDAWRWHVMNFDELAQAELAARLKKVPLSTLGAAAAGIAGAIALATALIRAAKLSRGSNRFARSLANVGATLSRHYPDAPRLSNPTASQLGLNYAGYLSPPAREALDAYVRLFNDARYGGVEAADKDLIRAEKRLVRALRRGAQLFHASAQRQPECI